MPVNIDIVDFSAEHLSEAYQLAYAAWGKELSGRTPQQLSLVYQYLVEYYYCSSSRFNFAAMSEGKLRGFLLARSACGKCNQSKCLLEECLDSDTQALLQDYKSYLDENQAYEDECACDGDVLIQLFVSNMPGCGKLLLNALQERALSYQYTHLLLWTDDTCSCSYYPSHGFELVCAKRVNTVPSPVVNLTYIYRKPLFSKDYLNS